MGRKTFESLPKGALPNRRNIVITQNEALHWPHVETCHSLEESIALTESEDEIFIIGGGSVYQEAMDIAGKLYVTKIHHQFKNADTFFPWWEQWKLVSEENHEADAKNKYDYSFFSVRKSNKSIHKIGCKSIRSYFINSRYFSLFVFFSSTSTAFSRDSVGSMML